MPDGLTDVLTHGQFVDLVKFLSELGKVGPYSASKARLVRRVAALEAAPETPQRLLSSGAAALDDPSLRWQPVYSTVAGLLPLTDLPHTGETAVVRCQVEASTPGPVILRLNTAKGLRLWLDRKSVEVKDSTELNLTPGVHTLTFAVDLNGTRRHCVWNWRISQGRRRMCARRRQVSRWLAQRASEDFTRTLGSPG